MACANISTNASMFGRGSHCIRDPADVRFIAVIGEITDDTNAARAFALPSVGYAIGIIVGLSPLEGFCAR